MTKNVILAGLSGGVILLLWTFLVNGIFGFKSSIDMKVLPDEKLVYDILKENVIEPGRYAVNPELTEAGTFPDDEPAFSVLYGGVGHEASGALMFLGLAIFFAVPLIAAWMLSRTSDSFLSSYLKKVFFFTCFGFLFALFGDMTRFGIAGYPPGDTIKMACHSIAVWTAMGFVIAGRIKPKQG